MIIIAGWISCVLYRTNQAFSARPNSIDPMATSSSGSKTRDVMVLRNIDFVIERAKTFQLVRILASQNVLYKFIKSFTMAVKSMFDPKDMVSLNPCVFTHTDIGTGLSPSWYVISTVSYSCFILTLICQAQPD